MQWEAAQRVLPKPPRNAARLVRQGQATKGSAHQQCRFQRYKCSRFANNGHRYDNPGAQGFWDGDGGGNGAVRPGWWQVMRRSMIEPVLHRVRLVRGFESPGRPQEGNERTGERFGTTSLVGTAQPTRNAHPPWRLPHLAGSSLVERVTHDHGLNDFAATEWPCSKKNGARAAIPSAVTLPSSCGRGPPALVAGAP